MITTVILVFLSSLVLAMAITPLAREFGRRYGIVDKPSARKVHSGCIPRFGGVAIFLSFYIPFALAIWFLSGPLSIAATSSGYWLVAGSVLVFALGLADDIRRLPPHFKFGVQIIAAVLAYAGGMKVCLLELPLACTIDIGWLSLPLTVFWFLLVINAINLIDGLDGLASGLTLFASIVLLILSVSTGRPLVSIGLACLAGACLGFLRYNFNPASIFLGDGGSYFIGYALASLSLLGTVKSEATVAILIPIIALGVPLIDTVLAPVRRFIIGKRPFYPDNSHIHHRLLQMGLTHRRAVLVLYAATIAFGCFALALVYMRNELHALILGTMALTTIICIRKLGYFQNFAFGNVVEYARDVADEVGLSKERRCFLNQQVAIGGAQSHQEMWEKIIETLQFLQFDYAEIHFAARISKRGANGSRYRYGNGNGFGKDNGHEGERFIWCDNIQEMGQDASGESLLSIHLPLISEEKSYGSLILKKDLTSGWDSHYTLKRVEHLRRGIVRKLEDLDGRLAQGAPKTSPAKSGGQERAHLPKLEIDDPHISKAAPQV